MNHQERGDARLARSLEMLAEIEDASTTPVSVEAAVMAGWDTAHAPQARSRRSRVVRAAATTAAGITLVSALAWQPIRNERANVHDAARLEPDATNEYTTVAVVGGPLMAGEPIRVVRMRVARSVLGELGIPSSAQHGAAQVETVDIDVLVGEDGVARGVRVPISEL
jgi:hypothetical protein